MPVKDKRASVNLGLITDSGGSGASGKVCTVQINVYQDGVAVTLHKVVIGGITYQHGDKPNLSNLAYTLAWSSGDTAYLYKWTATGNVAVANAYASSTTLTVTCGGTLSLYLTSLPASNYDDLVGTIWMPEPQGYDNREGITNMIEVRDPYGTGALGESNGGTYDNR